MTPNAAAVEGVEPYGLQQALEYLAERAAWLQREIDNGGDFKYLSLKREECLYVRESIRSTAERVNRASAVKP